MADRIEALKSLLEQDPNNSRMRYMLANEYVNTSQLTAAIEQFQMLISLDPNYVPGYFQAGKASEALGDPLQARRFYEEGIATAGRTGDSHASAEMQAALDLLR